MAMHAELSPCCQNISGKFQRRIVVWFYALIAFMALSITGCLSPQQQKAIKERDAARQARANRPVYCDGQEDCEVKWGRALKWVKDHSEYKFDQVTENLISTKGPLPHSVYPAYMITKVPQGAGRFSFDFNGGCDNWIYGCSPPLMDSKASFIDFVMGPTEALAAPPSAKAQETKPNLAAPTKTKRREATGSGFFIDAGHVITNEHVVHGMDKCAVYQEGERYIASIIQADEENDIAVLELDQKPTRKMGMVLEGPQSISGLRIGNVGGVKQGDHVWTLGFPLSAILGEQAVLTEGTISSLTGVNGDQRFFTISAPIQPGNSGSPLLNDHGEVIGIAVSSLDVIRIFELTGTMPQNINFAIKISYAEPYLSKLSIGALFKANSSPSQQPITLSSLVEGVKSQVVLIKALQTKPTDGDQQRGTAPQTK